MSSAWHGYGSVLQVEDSDGSNTFTTIAEITTISPGAMTTDVIDVSHLSSANTHREKKPGMKDTEALGFEGNYIPTDATHKDSGRGLIALWKGRTQALFRIVLNDGSPASVLKFTGFISSLQIGEIGNDDKVPVSGEITPITQYSTLP